MKDLINHYKKLSEFDAKNLSKKEQMHHIQTTIGKLDQVMDSCIDIEVYEQLLDIKKTLLIKRFMLIND